MCATATKKIAKSPRRDTRARIVDGAIAMFNRHGLQSVTIEQLCAKLQISTGNLTYHFKRKDDLIRATLDEFKSKLLIALQRPEAVNTPEEAAKYLIRTYNTFWSFRFYFNALEYLLTNNPQLRQEHEAIRNWIIGAHESAVTLLGSRGVFHTPVAPNSFRLLSENIWALLMNWLRQQQVAHPLAAQPTKAALQDIALHMWSLCQQWLQPDFSRELLAAFERLLKQPGVEKTEPLLASVD